MPRRLRRMGLHLKSRMLHLNRMLKNGLFRLSGLSGSSG
jgi:hypothetical protein